MILKFKHKNFVHHLINKYLSKDGKTLKLQPNTKHAQLIIDNLPIGIEYIYCSSNNLKSLDKLPDSVIDIDCSYNNITFLDNLPKGVTDIDCSYNNITFLDNLPDSVEYLYCSDNKIESLDNLPKGVTTSCLFSKQDIFPRQPSCLCRVYFFQ